MTALNFLRRSCGSWTSQRRYLYAPNFEPVNLTTNFTLTEDQLGRFTIDWAGPTNGEMILTLEGDTLSRSRDYFGKGANSSKVQVIDSDCIVMTTSYHGCRFREEVRLIESDMFRLRQTVGFDLKNGQVVLSGQYWEARV